MNLILSFSIVGISGSIFLGCLLLSKKRRKLIPNMFLGLFFLLLSIRLGKLIVQEYAPDLVVRIYFNLMHAAFLAIGPVIWFYIRSYLSTFSFKKNNLIHFIPSFIFLLGAYYLRENGGEKFWIVVYWAIQAYPIFYIIRSLKFLIKNSDLGTKTTLSEKIWIYSLLGATAGIVSMNILYFTLNFPFYLVTGLLLIVTVYLFTYLAFNNKVNIIIGTSRQKYKNLNLNPVKVNLIRKKIDHLLHDQELYLQEQLKISDISSSLSISNHMVSSVINLCYEMSFPQYINLLRIKRSQKKLIEEKDEKIIKIALESGFSSLSAFNRAFKNNVHMNPSTYRSKFSVKKVPDL